MDMMVSLGLDHVADTMAGNKNLRVISDRQKRRLTVGEMILDGNCRFVCLENITDGLSSTNSIKLIRDLVNNYHTGGYLACISVLQPSDKIIHLFNKLLILTDNGKCSYFGPVDRPL
mmetsp:Transcript_19839/g.41591  ORF Transcript_19839/g.41591 Transcript_19839/m.41591 type:complete len:117 (-) Transcript_19839:1828-2178(-)